MSISEVIEIERGDGALFDMNEKKRKTTKHMTKYEYSRLLAVRTLQITMGAPTFVDTTGIYDATEIAKREIQERKIPLVIRRVFPNGSEEFWDIKDMVIRDY